MIEVEADAVVSEDGTVSIESPRKLPPGRHRIWLRMEDRLGVAIGPATTEPEAGGGLVRDADRTVFRCEVDSDFDLSEFMDTARESELLRLG